MAKVSRDQGKTSFVKDFLGEHPESNVAAVNAAWTAAGKEGTIGSTLINKMRSQMGLTGNLRASSNSRAAANGKATRREPETATVTPGKTAFVKEFLNDHNESTSNDVNQAWTAAGFSGTISRTLVDKTRALLGLTGNLRGKTKKVQASANEKQAYSGKKRGRKPKEAAASGTGQPRAAKSRRPLLLDELEADIDRLIFRVMGVGNLTEIEESLRRARRLLFISTDAR